MRAVAGQLAALRRTGRALSVRRDATASALGRSLARGGLIGVRGAGVIIGVALVVAVVAAALLWLPGLHHPVDREPASRVPVSWQRQIVRAEDLPDRLGVRLVRVSVSGGGGLIDLRYQVVNPDQALAIHDDAQPPAVVDERSGLVVSDLFMGHAHKGDLKPAVTYYLVFNDPGGWIRRGDQVSVLLADVEVAHVTVA